MYSAALAGALHDSGIDADTAVALGLAGRSDAEVLAFAVGQGQVVLTENVADFARTAADHLNAGNHHPGLLIALSSRFSRRPAGISALAAAICAVAADDLHDRIVYLQHPPRG